MNSNRDIIRRTYEGSPEEKIQHLLAALSPDVEWTEAEGFPYAGTYVGIDALLQGIFQRLATEWNDYRADVHTYLAEGDRVAAFGIYSGTYKATGKSMTAHFVHLYQLRDGRIVRMQQYVDSALVQGALT